MGFISVTAKTHKPIRVQALPFFFFLFFSFFSVCVCLSLASHVVVCNYICSVFCLQRYFCRI